MPKKKNETDLVPRKLQQLFIMAATAAFMLNAVFWLYLLVRVYSRGFRVSQFSVIALGEILLPAILFIAAYTLVKASSSRIGHLFMASLLALTGALVQKTLSLLDVTPLLTSIQTTYHLDPLWTSSAYMLMTLLIFGGLILFIARQKERFSAARVVVRAFSWTAFIFFAAGAFASLTSIEIGGSPLIASIPISPMQLTQIVLPLTFVAAAYFSAPKIAGRREGASLLIVITAVGIMIFQAIVSLGVLIQQSSRIIGLVGDNSILLAAVLSFIAYGGIIATYSMYDRRSY